MKKFIFMFLAMLTMAIGANAQQNNVSGSSLFSDDWSLGVNVGGELNLHDWNAPQGGYWGLTLNKDITPIIGVTVEANMGFNTNANWLCHKMIPNASRHMGLSHGGTKVEDIVAMLDGRINLMNAFGHYRGIPRRFNIEGVVGVGYRQGFSPSDDTHTFLFGTGLNFNYFLTKSRTLELGLRPRVIWDVNHPTNYLIKGEPNFGVNKLDSRKAVAQLNLTLTWHFNNSNGLPYFSKYKTVEPIPVIREVIKEKIVEKTVVQTIEKPTPTTYIVTFPFNSDVIENAQKTILDKVEGKVSIVAYASPEGTDDYNLALSQRRADSVRKYLEAKGVTVVEAVGSGSTNVGGRIAIITVQ